MKKRTIKAKLLKVFIPALVSIAILIMVITSVSTYSSTIKVLDTFLVQSAASGAATVRNYMEGQITLMEEFASLDYFQNPTDLETTNKIMDDFMKRNGFGGAWYADVNGDANNGRNISDRAYFGVCESTLKGCVSDMLVSKDDGSLSMMLAAPVLTDGKFNGLIIASFEGTKLSEITNSIQLGETGQAYILDGVGTFIAHPNAEWVSQETNIINQSKEDKSLVKLSNVHKNMIAGLTDLVQYNQNGKDINLAYIPVGVNGWTLGVSVETQEYLMTTIISILLVILLSVLLLVICTVMISRMVSKNISEPIKQLENAATEMAKGNFDIAISHKGDDELGILAESMRMMTSDIGKIVYDIQYILGEMGNGNFQVRTKCEESYMGMYKEVLHALRKINTNLSVTLREIDTVSDQVSQGAYQFSDSAAALSEGSMEQAVSVEKLSAGIEDVANQVKESAKNANSAKNYAKEVEHEVLVSNQNMQDMSEAMGNINSKAAEISKIIKDIEDIASQTNMLAINAAIEAARAGEVGKGFVVVAQQVRDLAFKSSQAAQTTTKLISETVVAVENGNNITENTVKSMEEVVGGTKKITELVVEIADASKEQEYAIGEINQGVEKISGVVQVNSATSEETAAASQELSSQAKTLKELTGKFKLKNV